MNVRYLKWGLIFICVTIALSIPDARIATGATANYEVAAVKAYLFYNHKGVVSNEDASGQSFFNIIIENDPENGPSQTVMAVVEVKGEPGSFEAKRKLELLATEGKRVVLKKTVSIGLMNEEGGYYEAFVLNEVGCSPLKISARILGQSRVSKKESVVDFQCGE